MPRKSGNDSHDLVGETPILNPRAIGNVNQPRSACLSLLRLQPDLDQAADVLSGPIELQKLC
jgi:hypothetical protein